MTKIDIADAERKRRYVTLDGLRGAAALIVVAFHSGRFLGVWVPRFGYLAVDLFFLLSGFVLAHAYEWRFRRGMTAAEFLVARVVRLYPLYFLGLLLGTCVALRGLTNPDIPLLTYKHLWINFGLNLFALPAFPLPSTLYPFDFLFVLNGPFWSLFFEFWVANIAFAVFRNCLGFKTLSLMLLLGAVGLIFSAKYFYTLDVGPEWQRIAAGFARVGFSFFCGVAIARLRAIRPSSLKIPSWAFIIALPIVLSVPLDGRYACIYELVCVLVVFPTFIYWGAEAVERNTWLGSALGDASYAAYTIHFPLWIAASSVIAKLALHPRWEFQLIFVAIVGGLAWGLNLIDAFVRAAVMQVIKQRRQERGALAAGTDVRSQFSS